MSGRRNAGGAAAALNLMSQLLIQKQQEQKQAKQRAAELYQKFAYEMVMEQVKKGTLRYDPVSGKMVQSQPTLKATDYMTPDQTAKTFSNAVPGTPLPSTRTATNSMGEEYALNNIPMGTRGANTMNQAISSGMTESPAAIPMGNKFAPWQIPEGPYFPGPNGTAIGASEGEAMPGSPMMPKSSVLGILNSGSPSVSPLRTSSGKIRVRRKADGATGTLSESDFDKSIYERI